MSRVKVPVLPRAEYVGPRVLSAKKNRKIGAALTDMWCDRPAWPDRFRTICKIIPFAKTHSGKGTQLLALLLTALLEESGETEISCIEAAAAYSISMHAAWRAAGGEYVDGVDPAVFDAWCAQNHTFVRFAGAASALYALPEGSRV